MAVIRFYPYRTAGPVELEVAVDGGRLHAPVVIDAHGQDRRLDLVARLPANLVDVVAPGGEIEVLARVRSRSSQRREGVRLAPDGGPGVWAGPLDLHVDEWFGTVTIDVVAVLAAAVDAPAGYAAGRGSVLAESDSVSVVFGEVAERNRGRSLTVEWRTFSDGDEWLRSHADHVFALEPVDPPVLLLNTEVVGSYALLSAKGTRGIRARVRDLTFVQIAHQVWSQLLTTAFSQLADLDATAGDADGLGLIDELGGWNRAALLDWLPLLYPGFDLAGAADQLLDDVRSPFAMELTLRRVPTAIQAHLGSADRLGGILREARLVESVDAG